MKILLIADETPDALLDVQCVIQRLIRKHRECRISLMAPAHLHSLARRLVGLDDLLTLPDTKAAGKLFWIAGRQLEEWQKAFEPFDQALVFTSRWKPSLVPWMAGIDRRSGTLGRFRFMLINDARWMPVGKFPTRRSRYLALADDHGEMSDEPLEPELFSDRDNAWALSKEHHLDPERPAMVFCPGGDLRSGQRWPIERWTKLAEQLIDQGWQVWLIAPRTERAFCEQICAGLDHERQMDVSNLSGRLAWDDKLDLLAQSRAVLAQETLYSQLCRALNHPLVMLRGSGELDVVIPEDHDLQGNQSTPQRAQVKTVSSDRTCQPCHDLVCRQHKNKATDPCIHDLSVERVRSALLSMVPMQAVD
ncbi:lipopolysaccharide heptosyltransferase II [Oceanospirillum linum]|uniref:lipopolysaccharide heptosyltransferase II n=1 Tax=Oceanospirillum linum TaxID=966 RepID=A0A1T1HB73_OCELI|nr:lipopolysaccharide heptosyltransferase II [Oceanospirillum linum]OOV87104.1 lipopolysaccharide heptosyltransferase II [Oceanospirillum linum]SEF74550.1 Glycosyltransferase family 9 (heptosyltransferase) [Oleiphilus messinensis]SMP16857.1 lipopolysaccharide heptosyltransferase II [Oceanospirillum linum]